MSLAAHWHTHILSLYLLPSITNSPSPLPHFLSLSLLLFPWQASDWHLQITRRQWHCVWPLSLISSLPPFCHLITVNPRPAAFLICLPTPSSPSHTLSIPLFHSPAAYFTCFSAQYLECSRRVYILLCALSVFCPPPPLSYHHLLLFSSTLECHSVPHIDQSMSTSLFAFQISPVSLKCLVNMLFSPHDQYMLMYVWRFAALTAFERFEDFTWNALIRNCYISFILKYKELLVCII